MSHARTTAAQGVSVLGEGPGGGHYFSYRGKPLLLVGDSVTQGWMECGTGFDQEAYVEAMARRRITCLLLWSFMAPMPGDTDPRIAYDAQDQAPWVKVRETPQRWDLFQWNEAYWGRLTRLVSACRERGIVVVVTVFDGWTKTRFAHHPFNRPNGGPLEGREAFVRLGAPGEELAGEAFDATWDEARQNQWHQERFAARMVDDLGGFDNVIYELFNEGEWYDRELRRAHERHFASFFKRRGAPIVVSNSDHIAGFPERDEPNVDALSFHKPRWDSLTTPAPFFDRFRAAYDAAPVRPLILTEPVPSYEGGQDQRRANMRLLWGALLGGAAGAVVQNDLSFGFDPKSALASKAGERDAMLDIEGGCARFFNGGDVRWWEMRPHSAAAASGVALSRPGEEVVVYTWGQESVRVDLRAAEGDAFEARILDPETGKVAGPLAVRAGKGMTVVPLPSKEDRVVHLKKVTSG